MSRVERLTSTTLVLSDLQPIDGRVSWLTPMASGYEPYNEYLLLSEEAALLIETGVAIHGPSLVPTLKELVGARRLFVFPTRIELDSIGNLARILEAVPGTVVCSANPIEPNRLVHRPDGSIPEAPFLRFQVGDDLGAVGFANVRVVDPAIRTLGTAWLYDDHDRVLFSADCFCTDLVPESGGEVIRRAGEAYVAPEGLRASILQKFDWLDLVDSERLEEAWVSLFTGLWPIEALAPTHGRVQFGNALVVAMVSSYFDAVFRPHRDVFDLMGERLRWP